MSRSWLDARLQRRAPCGQGLRDHRPTCRLCRPEIQVVHSPKHLSRHVPTFPPSISQTSWRRCRHGKRRHAVVSRDGSVPLPFREPEIQDTRLCKQCSGFFSQSAIPSSMLFLSLVPSSDPSHQEFQALKIGRHVCPAQPPRPRLYNNMLPRVKVRI